MRINHICAFIYFFVVSYTFLLKHTSLHTGVFGRPHNLKLRWEKNAHFETHMEILI